MMPLRLTRRSKSRSEHLKAKGRPLGWWKLANIFLPMEQTRWSSHLMSSVTAGRERQKDWRARTFIARTGYRTSTVQSNCRWRKVRVPYLSTRGSAGESPAGGASALVPSIGGAAARAGGLPSESRRWSSKAPTVRSNGRWHELLRSENGG